MLIYNLLEYIGNYSMARVSLWNYYRDELNDPANENANHFSTNNNKTTKSKSFEYNTKIIERTSAYNLYIRHRSCCSVKLFD